MRKIFKPTKINDKKGFALLFSVLVSVMILAVGASIINIALKQVILSSAGRESQFAFYAANTGLECALYWDLNGATADDDGKPEYVFPPPGEAQRGGEFYCSGVDITDGDTLIHTGAAQYLNAWVSTQNAGETEKTKTFRIAVGNTVSGLSNVLYCAEVKVTKSINPDNDIITTIESQGLNTCDPDNDNRAVQRGLVLQYRS